MIDFLSFINEHSHVTEKVKAECSKAFLKQLEEQLQDVYISCRLVVTRFRLLLEGDDSRE